MSVSQKCQYGLRALFELARRRGEGVTRLQEVATAQAIPQRFLENILNQLRQGGFVESRRGKNGGFTLARAPSAITLLEIISFIDGPIHAFDCEGLDPLHKCPLRGGCIFMPVWTEARTALERVYAEKTLQDLLDAEINCKVPAYDI